MFGLLFLFSSLTLKWAGMTVGQSTFLIATRIRCSFYKMLIKVLSGQGWKGQRMGGSGVVWGIVAGYMKMGLGLEALHPGSKGSWGPHASTWPRAREHCRSLRRQVSLSDGRSALNPSLQA